MKTIEVVAAVIVRDENMLCVQRADCSKEYVSLKWEFPGGKVEVDGACRHEVVERVGA